MTITVNLPEHLEQAFIAEARAKGITVDALMREVLLAHPPVSVSSDGPKLIYIEGIPALRSGHPLAASVLDETLELVRQERESAILG